MEQYEDVSLDVVGGVGSGGRQCVEGNERISPSIDSPLLKRDLDDDVKLVSSLVLLPSSPSNVTCTGDDELEFGNFVNDPRITVDTTFRSTAGGVVSSFSCGCCLNIVCSVVLNVY